MTPKQLGELDWVSALEWCRDNSKLISDDHKCKLFDQAGRWDQCAMCELPIDKRVEEASKAEAYPEDMILKKLGLNFYENIVNEEYSEALKTIDQIRERELELYGETYG